MRVMILAFGRLKTPGLKSASEYYQRLLKTWVKVQEVELKPCPILHLTPALHEKIQHKEKALLLDALKKVASQQKSQIFLLEERAPACSTLQWVNWIRNWYQSGVSQIIFCLGSSLGFSPSLQAEVQGSFGLGPQTLSYELARIVLWEQLYRSWSCYHGHPYHKLDDIRG